MISSRSGIGVAVTCDFDHYRGNDDDVDYDDNNDDDYHDDEGNEVDYDDDDDDDLINVTHSLPE